MKKSLVVLSLGMIGGAVLFWFLGFPVPPAEKPADQSPPSTKESPRSLNGQSTQTSRKDSPAVKLAGPFGNELAPVYDGHRWGYIDREGTWKIEPQYRSAQPFKRGLAKVRDGKRWYYINASGERMIGLSRRITPRTNPRNSSPVPFRDAEQWGYVNKESRTVIPPTYDWAGEFSEGRAVVEHNNRIGYLNDRGETVVDFIYQDGRSFKNGRAAVKTNGNWGYIARGGTMVVKPAYEWAKEFENGLAPVRQNAQWGYINRAGKMVVEPKYDFAAPYHEQRALVKKGDRFGFIGPEGDLRIPLRYGGAGSFSEGRARVLLGDKWGYINRSGDTVIPGRYEVALNFSGGLAGVYHNQRWIYVNRQGSTVLRDSKLSPDPEVTHDTSYRFKRLRTLTELQPLFTAGGREYVTSETSKVPHWKLARRAEDQPVGMYKVTRYPHDNPTPLQHEGAEELLRLSKLVVEQNGWWNVEQKPRRYNNRQFQADRLRAHYLSKNDLSTPDTLNPRRPEWLIYYPTPRGRKLAGFMFSTLSRSRGPQIGGPLTQWHYHQKQKNRIQRCREGSLPGVRNTPCAERKPVRHTPLMLHLWFIEHASGPFGSSPKLKPYIMDQLMNEKHLTSSELTEKLFCERNCLSKDYRETLSE